MVTPRHDSGDAQGSPQKLLVRLAWVRGVARALVRDADLAEDLAQQAALVALERGSEAPRALGGWLRGVVRRLAALTFREGRRRERRELAAAAREAQPATVDVVARLALHRRVVDAVESLAEPYRSAVLLRFYDGLPPREIAVRLEVPVRTVETRLARGLEHVRARLVSDSGRQHGGFVAALAPLLTTGAIAMGTKTKLALAAAALALASGAWWAWPRLAPRGRDGGDRAVEAARAAAIERSPVEKAADPAVDVAVERAPETSLAPSDAASPSPLGPVIRVHVVDSARQPVAGAQVELVRREGLDLPTLDAEDYAREVIVREGVTGSDGVVALDVLRGRPYDVRARAGPHLAATSRSRYAGETVELELAALGSLRGRVTTTAGAPVADARVILSGGEVFVPVRALATGLDGGYVATGLRPGRWWGSVQSLQGNAVRREPVELAPGAQAHLDFVVGEGALLRGRVTEAESGAPIGGVEIFFGLERQLVVRTDTNGEYRWPGFVMSGMQPLYARARGFGGAEKWLRDVSSGECVQDFALTRGRRARGRVVDGEGRPLGDVYVAALASEHAKGGQKIDHVATRSGADGTFELADLRREMAHFVLLRREGFATCAYAFPESELEREEVELGEFVLAPGGGIEGRVVDADGAPMPACRVELAGVNPDWARALRAAPAELPMTLWTYLRRRTCTSDANGAFHFANLPAGRFELSARRPGADLRATASRTALELSAGEVRGDVELRLPRSGTLTIEGRVVDERGRELKNVFVRSFVERGDGTLGRGPRGAFADGRFRLEGLEPGEHTLEAELYDLARPDAPDEVFLEARREHVVAGARDVEIVLPAGVLLAGRVTERDGAPVRFAQVALVGPDGERRAELTNDDGRFRFVLPPETSVTLEVRRPIPDPNGRDSAPTGTEPPSATFPDVVAEDGDLTIVLPPANQ